MNRKLFLVLIGVMCLAGLALLPKASTKFENWWGKRKWEQYRRELAAQGEHLDLAYFIPPRVPDDQNFAMTRMLKPLLEYQRDPETREIVFDDPNPPVKEIRANIQGLKAVMPPMAPWMTGRPLDFAALRDYYFVGMPGAKPSKEPAQDVLVALSKFDGQLAELRAESMKRPLSRFPVRYEEGFAAILPHLTVVQQTQKVVAIRASAALRLKHAGPAFADVLFGFRLMASVEKEPTIISGLVRISMMAVLMQPVWDGLESHQWTDSQLAQIEEELRRIDFAAEYAFFIRAERANINDIFITLSTGPTQSEKLLKDMAALYNDFDTMKRMWAYKGVIYRNLDLMNHLFQDDLLSAVDVKNQRFDTALQGGNAIISDRLKQSKSSDEFIAREVFPVCASATKHFAEGQNYANEALIACEIERYRLAHGALPATLEALKMTGLPHDVVTGQPLHYRVAGADNYVLYSVGWNGIDDGGKVVLKPNSSTPDTDQGDWVWSLKPL